MRRPIEARARDVANRVSAADIMQAAPDDAGLGNDAADRFAGFFTTWDDHAYVEWAFDEDVKITKIKFWLEHKLFPCYYRWQVVRWAWKLAQGDRPFWPLRSHSSRAWRR